MAAGSSAPELFTSLIGQYSTTLILGSVQQDKTLANVQIDIYDVEQTYFSGI